jgi:hypothetical protein
MIACRVLVGKPKRKRPPGIHRRRWEDNIKVDLGETGWGIMDWINLTRNRDQWLDFVHMITNLRVPSNFEKSLSSCERLLASQEKPSSIELVTEEVVFILLYYVHPRQNFGCS